MNIRIFSAALVIAITSNSPALHGFEVNCSVEEHLYTVSAFWTEAENTAWGLLEIYAQPRYREQQGYPLLNLTPIQDDNVLMSLYPNYVKSWHKLHSANVWYRNIDGAGQLKNTSGNGPSDPCSNQMYFQPSPILLDLDRNQFHLSEGPVEFDIDADGELETLTWVSPDELDAFLYLDRNGNSVVDDGSELFGNATPLFGGSVAENGYQVLAEFDLAENGGVNDGVIDAEDSVFGDLRVWIDIDADGISELEETLSLSDASVLAIQLDYWESPRTDPYGNSFRYFGRGWIEVNGVPEKMWTTDVFFNYVEE